MQRTIAEHQCHAMVQTFKYKYLKYMYSSLREERRRQHSAGENRNSIKIHPKEIGHSTPHTRITSTMPIK